MRLLKQLFWVLLTLGVLFGVMSLFTYDVIKVEWPSFMEIQPSYKNMEEPRLIPARSIPVEGPAFIPGLVPENPISPDEGSVGRGAELFSVHCAQCHGATGEGNGPISPFLLNFKPANLTTDVVQSKSDGSMFMTISSGLDGRMPALNENLTVSERWDVVNFLRTLKAAE